MARKPDNTAKAASGNGNRDIRSFFAAGQAAKATESTLPSSQASEDFNTENSTSPSSTPGLELPNGARARTRSQDVKVQRQTGSKDAHSRKAQDERSYKSTESQGGIRGTQAELQPNSALRRLLYTPERKRSRSRRSRSRTPMKNSATPKLIPSGAATGSSRKVRFSSLPLSARQSPEPEEEATTPRRLLFERTPPAHKAATESPPGSPSANALPELPPLLKNKPLGTPKRIISSGPTVHGTPDSLPSLPSLPSSPSMLPSPSTTKTRPTLTRDAVIKGSDDEDDEDDSFSDCSLPDLDMLIPSKPRIDGTPKAKRRAKMVHKSPLTIQPKHKFDFKTLDAHSRRHDALFDSPKRPAQVELKDEVMNDAETSPSKARQKLIEIAGVKTEEDTDKALKAMERTDAGASKTKWYFFKKDGGATNQPAPFPKKCAKGPWSFLGKAGTRDQHILSGMPTNLAASVSLPDDLYLWILDMVYIEKVGILREEYRKLASANAKQIKRLVTPRQLEESLRRLGASDHIGDETLKPVREVRDIYADRDWKPLQSFLEWLYCVADHLSYESVVYGIKLLLRMATDKIVLENPDILVVYQHALAALVNTVEYSAWNDFCSETCASLYHGFDKSSLRVLTLVCMPVTSQKLHELRRRLAVAFFLRDSALASMHPDDVVSLRLIIARVKDSDFQINNRTDYTDLKALVQLLDMAVDDGSFMPLKDDREHEKEFNEEIDELAKRLKAIWRSINDTGAANLSRTEAKSVLEWVGERLSYSVRTKRPPTQSIFGDQGPSSTKKKRQQDFMQKFVHSRKNKQAHDTIVVHVDSSSGEDDTFVSAIG